MPRYTREGKLKTISAYTKSPVVIQSPNPDSIRAMIEQNIFSYNKNNQTVILNNKYRYPINQIVTTPYGILKFVPNKYYREMMIQLKNNFIFH